MKFIEKAKLWNLGKKGVPRSMAAAAGLQQPYASIQLQVDSVSKPAPKLPHAYQARRLVHA